ncbi:hypothetical protein [Tabrizicola aquatica]|uniref:hypothetical protein n=1 Tax=Tabrizicola aquatica TaxID=909926 RepID=UPI0011AF4583|nr:hypothetical protein [Tabrizicola aquatica]
MSYEQPLLCPDCVDARGHLRPLQGCTTCRGTGLVVPDWRCCVYVLGLYAVIAAVMFLFSALGRAT